MLNLNQSHASHRHMGWALPRVDSAFVAAIAGGLESPTSVDIPAEAPGVEQTVDAPDSSEKKYADPRPGDHAGSWEIDPETGTTEMLKYAVVDDVGTVINPLTLAGQMHGGIAQGVGQAFTEHIVFDPESGQLVTGTFLDYGMPRADDMCSFDVEENPVPTATNPLGVKGAGEAGNVGALAAIMNAVVDALAPLGVSHIDMPATPEKVWRAIRDSD